MIKILIKKTVGTVARIMLKAGLLPKRIVLFVDGGICSQMHFYLVGEMLRSRGNDVVYDLRWFRDCGLDCDGRFSRHFELLKLFPNLYFPTVKSYISRKLYEWSVYYNNDFFDREADPLAWLELHGPLYLHGYFHDPEEMFRNYFSRLFHLDVSILTGSNLELLNRIEYAGNYNDVCAIHVRRGDLAHYSIAYGNPASCAYFLSAMKKVISFAGNRGKDVKFFIFSDETDYVRKELLPLMNDFDVSVCDDNGSDQGYCDLALISRCRHVITSQGSMGKYGAMLRPDYMADGLVTLLPNDYSAEWLPRFSHAVIIDK